MENKLNNLFKIIEKIGKHNILLILFVFVTFIVTGLYQTFSIYTSSETPEIIDGLTTYKFILNKDETSNTIKVAANTSKNMDIIVSNNSDTLLKYGIYYSSTNTLSDVIINYSKDSKHKATGLIEPNSNYIVSIKVINNSNEDITIDFGLSFGLENGGDLPIESYQYWVLETKYLNTVPVGSYVKYTGNNGCTEEKCNGENANKSDTNNGYCQNDNFQYSSSGWRVAYIDNENAHLITAGAPECLCTNKDGSTSNTICNSNEITESAPLHIKNLNNIALKYCNPLYAEKGTCDNTTAWAFSAKDFAKITNIETNLCYEARYDTTCGYQNDLLDIEGQYWLASPSTNELTPKYNIQNWLGIESTILDTTSNEIYGVRPIIKLASTVFITGGTGTLEDPYIIEI